MITPGGPGVRDGNTQELPSIMSDVDLKDRSAYRVWTGDTIRYADLDPNDHVNNGAINTYFEDGRVRFRNQHLSHLGAGILAGFVLVKYTVEYHAMLHFPGEVDIGTTIVRIGGSSYTQGQGVFNGDTCIATAHGTYTIQPLLSPRHRAQARRTYSRFARMISVSR